MSCVCHWLASSSLSLRGAARKGCSTSLVVPLFSVWGRVIAGWQNRKQPWRVKGCCTLSHGASGLLECNLKKVRSGWPTQSRLKNEEKWYFQEDSWALSSVRIFPWLDISCILWPYHHVIGPWENNFQSVRSRRCLYRAHLSLFLAAFSRSADFFSVNSFLSLWRNLFLTSFWRL